MTRGLLILGLLSGCQVLFPLDGNPTAGDGMPAEPPRYLFATSERFTGALGGLAGADAQCARLASTAGLAGEFRAWLSVGDSAPENRMTQSAGPYLLVGDTPIADDWDDLVDGMLKNAIQLDEKGEPIIDAFICGDSVFPVWSNTMPSGLAGDASCGGWTDVTGTGSTGRANVRTAGWTIDTCVRDCTTLLAFYCIEQ
jgi:hypothetical protein